MSDLAAHLVVTNGRILTLDRKQPTAAAMAVRDGRIVAIGSDAEVLRLAGNETQRINLEQKTVVPGFIDSHLHLLMYGMQLLRSVDLRGCRTIDELLARLSETAKAGEGWICGEGFDQSKMAEGRFPTRAELDRVSKTRPILVSRVCGHAIVVNSAALAAVSAEARALGDEQTGLYLENSGPFHAAMPEPSDDEMEKAVLAASRVALRTGITSIQTLLDTPEQMRAYARLHRKGKLPIRVVGMPPYAAVESLYGNGIASTFGDERLRFGAAKLFSDGSLGAQTALLYSAYADKKGELGIRIYERSELKKKARDAQVKGFQLAIHAIGDQAVRETIDAIEYALDGESNEIHRHRIEHASMVAPDCLERLAKLKIVVTCQPQFVTSDTWTGDRVGKHRIGWCYPTRSLLRAGVPISLSSDCPVEKLDAFECLWAAVGRHSWCGGAEALTIEEAIEAYCMGSAYAGGVEKEVGSLEVGKCADFIVLDRDPRQVTTDDLRQLKTHQVFMDGRAVEA